MDRRKFLERMVVAASVAAVTPIIRDAIPSVGGEEIAEGESLTAFPIQDRPIASRTNQSELAKRFVHPPESAAPWVYWMWINIDTTPTAMTFDLEQMKAKGIPGFILYNSPSGGVPNAIPRMVLVDKDHDFEFEFVREGEYTGCYTTPIRLPPLESSG